MPTGIFKTSISILPTPQVTKKPDSLWIRFASLAKCNGEDEFVGVGEG